MKKQSDLLFPVIYFCLMTVVIVSGWMQISWLFMATKPLMLLLLFFYFRTFDFSHQKKYFRRLVLTAFLFCAAGDALLMFDERGEVFFLTGLIAFFCGHLLYTSAFVYEILKSRPWNQHWAQLAFSTLLVVYGAEFFILNRNSFGPLWLPVLFYCVAITIMGVAATMRDASKPRTGYYQVVTGAVLFIISDSLLATNKFIVTFEMAGPAVLVTYFVAQYLIAKGAGQALVIKPAEKSEPGVEA